MSGARSRSLLPYVAVAVISLAVGAAGMFVALRRPAVPPEPTRSVSYPVGRVDFLTMLSAFSALLEYRVRYAETMGNLYRTRAEIGPLVGESPLEWWEQSR